MFNPSFKVVDFDHFRMRAGLPNFVLSVSEWIEKAGAIGIIVKKGRYGGTYAFRDIAFEFSFAISVTFKLYLIEEFQRLKEDEQKQIGHSPNIRRNMQCAVYGGDVARVACEQLEAKTVRNVVSSHSAKKFLE